MIKFVSGQWFSPGTPVSLTNKTDRHDIAEILLKVALSTRTLTHIVTCCIPADMNMTIIFRFYIATLSFLSIREKWNIKNTFTYGGCEVKNSCRLLSNKHDWRQEKKQKTTLVYYFLVPCDQFVQDVNLLPEWCLLWNNITMSIYGEKKRDSNITEHAISKFYTNRLRSFLKRIFLSWSL